MIKIISKTTRRLLVALLMVAMLVPLLPATPVRAAGEQWLTGYTYRQEFTIGGSTAGAQTDFPMKVTTYSVESGEARGDPTNLTWVAEWTMPTAWDVLGHSQGAETDGTYVWWSSGNLIARSLVSNPDWENPLAINNHAMTDGTDMEQINGIHLQGDYIYATGIKHAAEPYRCFVKWYDRNTLVFVDEQEIFWTGTPYSGQEGIVYYGGYWWAIYFSYDYVAQYDTAFNFIANYPLPGTIGQVQGHDWFNDQLWISYSGTVKVFDWDGDDFTLAATFATPAEIEHVQSFGISPDGSYMYIADYFNVPDVEALHKLNITWEGGGGSNSETYLNNHAQADFDDVRFTKADGETELDYWIQEINAGDNATFWVEFDAIPESPGTATFYIYYGKGDASTTSDGEGVFTWFDNAESGTPASQGWVEEGGGGWISYSTDDKYRGTYGIKIDNTGGPYVKFLLSGEDVPTDYNVGMRVKRPSTTGDWSLTLMDTAITGRCSLKWEGTSADLNWHDGGASQDTGYDYSSNWELHEFEGVASTDVVKWYQDGVLIKADAHRSTWDDIDFYGWYSNGGLIWLDDLYLAKSSAPYPTWDGWGGEVVEDGEPDAPIISTNNPTSVNGTAGTLQGSVLDINDTSIAYRGFVWDTDSHANPGNVAIDATIYSDNWSESGNYGTGSFSHALAGLTKGELYYYRAGARNNDDPVEWAYGPENGLIARPDPPNTLVATPNGATQVDLTWVNGTGMDKNLIMRKAGSYPASVSDGTQVYFGVLQLISDYGLTPGTLFYYRAWSYVTEGGYEQYSSTYDQDTATTGTGFAITTGDATDLTSTSVTLGATLTDDEGSPASIRFLYGTSSPPTTPTVWEGGTWETGYSYSKDLSDLSPGTQYYYQAQAKHADEETVSGGIESFVTIAGPPGAPTNFSASVATDEIILTWAKGSGSSQTLIRYSTDTYPSSTAEGAFLYLAAGVTTTHTEDMVEGTTYYYSAWGETDGIYSVGYASTMASSEEPGTDPPNIISIENVRVYQTYIVPGDQIYMISYKLMYDSGNPIEPASDFFSFQIVSGTSIKAQVPVRMWGYRPGSIYLQPEAALPVGSALTIKLIGRADKWEAPVPVATFNLSLADWLGTNLADIDPWAISLAENMQAYYNESMVIYSAEGTVLSAQGGIIFSMGIPGLSTIRPSLFASSIEYVDEGFITSEDNLQPGLEPVARLGPYISGIITDWGEATFGSDLKSTWGFLIMITFAALVVVVGMMVGFIPAIAICVPIVLVGMWTGGVAVAIVMVVAAVLVMLILKSIWLRGN